MRQGAIPSPAFALLLVLLSLWPRVAARGQDTFTVLTYNTENTFDTIPSPQGGDEEFLPEGSHHWTQRRYLHKLRNLAQVLLAADTLHPVDLVLLQEVENDTVMHDLLHRTPLASIPYEYIITHAPDTRGINVAIAYSPRTFQLLHTDTIGCGAPTRQVLHACGRLNNGDTLLVYAVHLPSQLGGKRAQQLRDNLCDSVAAHILRHTQGMASPRVLVAGDFNDQPAAACVRRLCHEAGLTNLMHGRRGGSYKWRGRWQWLDQVLLSPALCGPEPRLVNPSYLLEEDTAYRGEKPRRAFMGPVWHDGYSDHLPVVLTLTLTAH